MTDGLSSTSGLPQATYTSDTSPQTCPSHCSNATRCTCLLQKDSHRIMGLTDLSIVSLLTLPSSQWTWEKRQERWPLSKVEGLLRMYSLQQSSLPKLA